MTLVWLAGAFIAGVVAGAASTLPPLPVAALGLMLVCIGHALRSRRSFLAVLAVAAFCLGLARASYRPHTVGPTVASYTSRIVRLDGVVAEEPDIRDTGSNYVIAVDSMTAGGTTRPVSGRVEVHTSVGQVLDYGDGVLLSGRLLAPRNDAALPYRDILARRGITALMRFPAVVDQGRRDMGLLGWVVPVRERLEGGINVWLPEPQAALLIAITLGARSASLGGLSPLLVSTGLIHIIAISGIKVAMVAGALNVAARTMGRRGAALAVSLAALWGYVLLTGATVSGERSAIMWTLVFLATYLGRNTVALVSLVVTAAVMIGFDPSLPWDPAFLLSAVGTLAIVSFTNPLLRLFRPVPSPIREALCVTLAAQIGTLPIVVSAFHVVSATGPVANAVVLPLLPLLIALGFLIGVLAPLPVIVAPLASLAYALLHLTVLIVVRLAAFPGAIPAGSSWGMFSVAYYVGLSVVAVIALRRAGWAPVSHWHGTVRQLVIGLTAAGVVLTASLMPANGSASPRVISLGGDSLLIRSNSQAVLVGGGARPYQFLERLGRVLPYRQRAINLLVVTDPRAGNVVALESVLQHYNVAEVLDVGAEYPSTTYARWRAHVRSLGIPAYALRTGASVTVGGARLAVVGPDALYPDPRDCIGMLRISLHRHTLLLAGAASRREQLEAVFRPVDLRANTLVIDGRQGVLPAFVRHVRARAIYTDRGTRTSMRLVPGREVH